MPAPATLSDLHAAIAWRLSGIRQEAGQEAAQSIFNLVDAGKGAPLGDEAMAVILDGLRIHHGGAVATVFHALLALGAAAAEDWHQFYPAAFVVLDAYRQARRASGKRNGDALDQRILAYLAEDISLPSEIWADLTRRAEDGDDDVIVDLDALAGTITFQPKPADADLVDIGFTAFRRRVQRLKKISAYSVRHEPASVAAAMDTAQNQPPRLAA